MTQRRLGRTDLQISPLGLGCWQFSEGRGLIGGFWEALPQDRVDAIVKAALEGGVTWFDTAEAYGKGRSEQALAHGLEVGGKRPGEVVVATKWQPFGRTARSITETIRARAEALAPYPIDLHQVHHWAGLSFVEAEMRAMADLVSAGRIRAVGVSNFGASRMRRAHGALAKRGIPLASNQMQYSLLDRRIERNGVLAAAKELGVTIIAYSPLAQGILSGKFHDDPSLIRRAPGPRRFMPAFRARGLARTRPLVTELKAIAAAHGATPSQVALAWLVTFHGDTVVAIPGATRPHHARESAAAMGLALSPRELERLDELSRAAAPRA
ncbi:MAG: aldo/keto reductase [Anaeromyxobacteraceae bacterium]